MRTSRATRGANRGLYLVLHQIISTALSLLLCYGLLAALPSSALVGGVEPARAQGGTQPGRGRRVKPQPPQPGAPAMTLPNLDSLRARLEVSPRTPSHIPSTLRSRRKPLEARRGRRVGDALPTQSASFTNGGEDYYTFDYVRFLVFPSYGQPGLSPITHTSLARRSSPTQAPRSISTLRPRRKWAPQR